MRFRILLLLCLTLWVAANGFAQTFLPSLAVDNQNVARPREIRKLVSFSNGYYAVGTVGDDLLVQRYNASGNLVASALWDNPQGDTEFVRDARIDTAGNLYVICEATSNRLVSSWYLKFNAALAIQFERRLDRLGDGKLAVTPGGLGVVVLNDIANLGNFAVRAFAANGNLIWSANRPGLANCIALDLNNNVWIGGATQTNVPTLFRWNAISGLGLPDYAPGTVGIPGTAFHAIAIDPNGTVYAAGNYYDLGNYAVIVRFTNVFTTRFDYQQVYVPTALRVDANFVYMTTKNPGRLYRLTKSQFSNPTGLTFVAAPDAENFTRLEIEPTTDRIYALTSNRIVQYTKGLVQTSNGLLSDSLASYDMARGPGGGSVLIGGFALGSGFSQDGRIQRVNQNGTLGTVNSVSLFGRAKHQFRDAQLDSAGDVFTCGLQGEGTDGLQRSFVHRVSAAGALVWRAELANFSPQAVVSDGTNVFVAGRTPTMGDSLFTVMRLNRTTGATVWTRYIAGAGEGDPRDLTIGANNDPIVCGAIGDIPVVYRLLKGSGDTVWTSTLPAGSRIHQQVHATPTSSRVAVTRDFDCAFLVMETGATAAKVGLLGAVKMIAGGGEILLVAKSEGLDAQAMRFSLEFDFRGEDRQAADGSDIWGAFDPQTGRACYVYRRLGVYYIVQNWGGSVGPVPIDAPIALAYTPNGLVALGSETYVDAETGTTTRMVLRRYNASFVLQEVQRINPPGPGLDTTAFHMLPAPSNRVFILGEMQRRNQGTVALYSRWQWNP